MSPCRQCNLKHHTLYLQSSRPTRSVNNTVKDNNQSLAAEDSVGTTPSSPENQIIATSISQQRTGNIFLQNAMIPILANGETTYCRAFLDSGSQSNLITDILVKRLGLPLRKHQTRIFGLGAMDELHHQETTDFLLTSKNETAIPLRAFVKPKLTNVLPSSTVPTTSWKHVSNLRLVHPTFNKPSGICMIYLNSLFGSVVIGGSPSVPIQSLTTCFS